MKMTSKKFQLSSMLGFRKTTDESSATHSMSLCILLDLTAPLKGHVPCTQRWESKSCFEREGGREAPPKMDGFQGRYQEGLPVIMDSYKIKCYRYMTHNLGACSSLAKLESHGWWFMFPVTVLSSKSLDTTILSPTVAKFIFSLSRKLQEVSKNPVSYAFQTPAPELGFLAFPANGYVATPCLDNRPSPGALYWAKKWRMEYKNSETEK